MNKCDYSVLDQPHILQFLFHPRADFQPPAQGLSEDIIIPVADGVQIGARLHNAQKNHPLILFFHGNGEVVSDYDDIGPVFSESGINFLVVDYRGYGTSTGSPTVSGMMQDSHNIFNFIKKWRKESDFTGPVVIMGRSLGSASALEIAVNYQDDIDGVIIESGFAYAEPLLRLLGADLGTEPFDETRGINNIGKIERVMKPALIIHAEYDHIIPYSDGETLYRLCGAARKSLIRIDGADHNSIFYFGGKKYFNAIRYFFQHEI